MISKGDHQESINWAAIMHSRLVKEFDQMGKMLKEHG
jgi:hypothetical protein